jgi:hypothetical protein
MRVTKAVLLSLIFLSFVTPSIADNYEGYTSEIEGVGVWWLQYGLMQYQEKRFGTRDIVLRRLTFGENPEFATYCDGKNKLFVFEKNSQGFTCKLEYWLEWQSSNDTDPWKIIEPSEREKVVQTIALAKKDKYSDAGQSEYYVSLIGMKLDHVGHGGVYTVSKTPFSQESWKIESLSPAVIRELQELAKDKLIVPKTFRLLVGNKLDRQQFEGSIGSGDIEKIAIKIKGNPVDILIAPFAVGVVGDVDGGKTTVVAAVFVRSGESLKFIGKFDGSLIRVGPDIDHDGLPELIVDDSLDYSQEINYYKVHPTMRVLMAYKHS